MKKNVYLPRHIDQDMQCHRFSEYLLISEKQKWLRGYSLSTDNIP